MEHRKKVRIIIILIVFLISSFILFLHSLWAVVPQEVEELYVNYLETLKFDYSKAVKEYCHFERPAVKEMIEQSTDYITSYTILGWKKLNNELWVVETSFNTLSIPGGSTMFNFVGLIDGKYYVMVNAFQVPPKLHKNFNPLHYIPSSAVPFDYFY